MSDNRNQVWWRRRNVVCLLLTALVALVVGLFEKRGEFLIFRAVTGVFFPQHGWHERVAEGDVVFSMAKRRERAERGRNLVIEFNDDAERFFSSVPAAPIDYAVVLENISLKKPRTVMIGANLVWEQSNEYAVEAMRRAVGKIPRVIFSAVLTRSPQGQDLPSGLMRCSLPMSAVRGEVAALPVVNRLAFAGSYVGGGENWCGFSMLEGITPQGANLPLMARWGDRVVFSSVFLLFLAEMGQALEEIQIEVGGVIRLPKDGTLLAIDEFGQMKLAAGGGGKKKHVMAHEWIDADQDADAFGVAQVGSLMLMDFCQNQSDDIWQAQERMVEGMEALRDSKVIRGTMHFWRVPAWVTWVCSGLFAVLLGRCGRRSSRVVAVLLFTGVWVLGFCISGFWMPYLAIVVVAVVGMCLPVDVRKCGALA